MSNSKNTQVSEKEGVIFLLSWLSNVNAGIAGKLSDLTDHATTYINEALGDSTIQSALKDVSNDPQSAVVWGPVSFTETDLDSDSVTDNLMYVFRGIQPGDSSKRLYVVAVAGTNPDSYYGWYSEDLQPGTMLNWPVVSDPCQGDNPLIDPSKNPAKEGEPAVALGFSVGLDKLWNHMSFQGDCILTFLNNEMTSDANEDFTDIEIAVAGHSLGGALAPMLALALQEKMDANGKNLTISTWPTAGPTPGESNFASYLPKQLGTDNYNAAFNDNDIVPHAFEMDMMQQLCNIYNDLNITTCNGSVTGIQANDLAKGILCYARSLPGSYDYERSDKDSTFTDPGVNFTDTNPITQNAYVSCVKLTEGAGIIYELCQQNFTTILNAVNPSDSLNILTVFNLLTYMAEAGYQHTDAYTMHYLGEELFAAVHQYVGIDSASILDKLLSSGTDEIINFTQLVQNAADFYNNGGTYSDCSNS